MGLKKDSDSAPGSGIHLWLILWKAAQAVEQNARKSVFSLGFGLSDFAVLDLLLHKGPQPINVIGRKILLTSGSITTAVDRLESRKLVRRRPHPEDRRARLVELTNDGRQVIECAFARHARDVEEAVAVLSEKERAELIRVLKKLGKFAAARMG
ncbi:MAG TPA: MarR family transcriptional regulator [Bryobacteraceae bacterium]